MRTDKFAGVSGRLFFLRREQINHVNPQDFGYSLKCLELRILLIEESAKSGRCDTKKFCEVFKKDASLLCNSNNLCSKVHNRSDFDANIVKLN